MPADSQRAAPTIRTLAAAPDLDAIAAAGTLCRAYSPRIAANGVDASGKVSKQIAANDGPTGLSFNRRAGRECNRRRPVVDASINGEGHRASVLVIQNLIPAIGVCVISVPTLRTPNALLKSSREILAWITAALATLTVPTAAPTTIRAVSPLAKPVHGEFPNA